MTLSKASLFLGTALAVMTIAGAPTVALAQSTSADREIAYAIPAQGLSEALRQFAEATAVQLLYDTKITAGKASSGVRGTMSSREALAQILAGSGLTFQFTGDRAVIINSAAAAAAGGQSEPGVRAVGVVNVEGVSGPMPFGEMVSPVNGVNGSRDVEATEGTGSYTTGATSIATKLPTPLRETPQSVSVVTSQRIDDQNLNSVQEILERMPGVSSTPGASSEEFSIYSRGFIVNTYSFDGGAPVSFDFNNRPAINTAEFDSVQLARGANGLFSGYGDPGGVVNLVRKKPLDHNQLAYEQDVGSFLNFREELDLTGPITSDKSLRARLVLSRLDREFYYDVAESHKSGIYGVVEYDVGPRTLFTMGGSYNRERNTPNQSGLPRYIDGGEINFPISTCLCVPFNYDRVNRYEVFATLNHQFSDGWSTKLSATYNDQFVSGLYYGVSAGVDRDNTAQARLSGFSSDNPVKQIVLEYTLNGRFRFLGRTHTFVVGANYQYVNNDGGRTYDYPQIAVPDIFNFDPSQYTDPGRPALPTFLSERFRSEAYGVYGNLRLELLKDLHASIGLRYSSIVRDAIFSYPAFDQGPFPQNDLKDRTRSRPNFGVTYEPFRNVTIYGTHQSIYQLQFATLGLPSNFIPPPITGSNDEVGIKWESPNKRLNASIAAYHITQKGFLQSDYDNPGSNIPLLQNVRSRGFDLEVTGEIAAGWQVAASYSFNDNKVTTDFGSAPKTSFTPRNLVKIWTTYRGAPDGPLDRFILGGGLDFQTKAFTQAFVCQPDPNDPKGPCLAFVPYEFTTKGYTTISAKVGYQLTKALELSVKVNNIGNVKTYSASPSQNVTSYNFYIPPRNFLATLRAKW